jgi:hypothetical protein
MLQRNVAEGRRYVKPPGIPEYYWDCICRCWCHSPNDRPTFQAILDEFRATHQYVFEGADMAEIKRYEEFVTKPIEGGGFHARVLEAIARSESDPQAATVPVIAAIAPLKKAASGTRKLKF